MGVEAGLEAVLALDHRLRFAHGGDETLPAGFVELALLAHRVPVALVHDDEVFGAEVAQQRASSRRVAISTGAEPRSPKVWTWVAPIRRQAALVELWPEHSLVLGQEAEGAELGAAIAGGGDLIEILLPGVAVAGGVVDAPRAGALPISMVQSRSI